MPSDNSKFTSARESGRGYHDIGGLDYGVVDPTVTEARPWEKLSIVLGNAIGRAGAKVICTDEVRRTREEMGEELYNELGYFERGIEATKRLLVEKGVINEEELEARMAQISAKIAEKGR
jgi:nitrile hydratase subunit beta